MDWPKAETPTTLRHDQGLSSRYVAGRHQNLCIRSRSNETRRIDETSLDTLDGDASDRVIKDHNPIGTKLHEKKKLDAGISLPGPAEPLADRPATEETHLTLAEITSRSFSEPVTLLGDSDKIAKAVKRVCNDELWWTSETVDSLHLRGQSLIQDIGAALSQRTVLLALTHLPIQVHTTPWFYAVEDMAFFRGKLDESQIELACSFRALQSIQSHACEDFGCDTSDLQRWSLNWAMLLHLDQFSRAYQNAYDSIQGDPRIWLSEQLAKAGLEDRMDQLKGDAMTKRRALRALRFYIDEHDGRYPDRNWFSYCLDVSLWQSDAVRTFHRYSSAFSVLLPFVDFVHDEDELPLTTEEGDILDGLHSVVPLQQYLSLIERTFADPILNNEPLDRVKVERLSTAIKNGNWSMLAIEDYNVRPWDPYRRSGCTFEPTMLSSYLFGYLIPITSQGSSKVEAFTSKSNASSALADIEEMDVDLQ